MDTIKNLCSEKVKNVFNVKENLRLVESKLKSLSCRASDLKQEVTKAEETGRRKRKREVENWFEEVEQVENKFNELISRIQDESVFNNISSADSVVKIGEDVDKLMVQSRDFEGRLWLDDQENRGKPLLVKENLFGQIVERGWKKIWDWLIKDDLFNIGIYGMGGVGKTTLAKCIHNHLLKKTDFKVFWVTVSQNFSVKKLQDDIAKQVPLDLSGEDDENRRAAMLSRAIANNSLIILDDVWEDFYLEDVGIPVGPKCRLILTTRSLELCNTMGCQGKFEVKCLEADEAWNLFKKTLDHGVILSVEVEKIAKLVAKECAGLPLGIITVARSMRGTIDVPEWRNALDQLTRLSEGNIKIEDKVFRILEWSFNRLNRCERLCFLYCCLYPEDWAIEREELINLFSLAELIPRKGTRKSEFDYGHTILNKLIKACLLEESTNWNGEKCVKMHDLHRDMALWITSGKYISKITEHVPVFLVKDFSRNESNNLLLKNEEWKDDLDAVSLTASSFGYILEIPPLMSPNCRSLSTLRINRVNIREIPDSFLHHMYGLKVLNLEGCERLQLLPSCISDMVNLTALLLEGCRCLQSVPPIGNLKKLRILNLFHTKVDDVPQGLEELVNLERLYMGHRSLSRARVLPEGTFSKLYHLQHLVIPAAVHISDLRVLNELQLYMGGLTYDQFAKSEWWPARYNILIVPLNVNESSENSYSCCFDFVFKNQVRILSASVENKLSFRNCNFQKGLDLVVPPENLHQLDLSGCSGLSDVFFHRWIDRSKELYHLELWDSEELEFVLNLSSADDDEGVASNLEGALRNLRVIRLYDLPNLVGLINIGRVSLIPPGTFSSLEELYIGRCEGLKKLFSVQLVRQCLQNLKRLTVSGCRQLEEIVEGGGEAIIFHQSSSGPIASITQELLFPKLQELDLWSLPKLENVCSPTITIGGDEPTKFRLQDCPKLKRLPSFCSVKSTSAIRGRKEWWDSLEWNNPSDKDAVQPYFQEWWNSLEWNNPRDKDAVQPFFEERDSEECDSEDCDNEDLEVKEQASSS